MRGIGKKEGNERKWRNRRNNIIPPLLLPAARTEALHNSKPISVWRPGDKSYRTSSAQPSHTWGGGGGKILF